MAKSTNWQINGKPKYKTSVKVGMKLNSTGHWVEDRKYFYGDSKKEAESKKADFLAKKKGKVSTERAYLGELTDYFVYKVFVHNNFSYGTKKNYINAYEKFFLKSNIAGQLLQEIDAKVLQEYYDSLDCSDSALKSLHNLLRHAFKYFSREGYCRDYTLSLQIPKKNKRGINNVENKVVIWEDYEIKKLLDGLDNYPNRNIALTIPLLLGTGLRISEMLALKYSDIHEGKVFINKQLGHESMIQRDQTINDMFIITSPKSPAAVRSIPLPESLIKLINAHKQLHFKEQMKNGYRSDFIFTTTSGGFVDRHNLRTAFIRYSKSVNLDPTNKGFHTFRHTFGTNLCRAGIPIQVASEMLGHTSIDITKKYYIHIDDSQKIDAIKRLETLYM